MSRAIETIRHDIMASDLLSREWFVASDLYGLLAVIKIFIPFILCVVLLPHLLDIGYGYVALPLGFLLLGVYGYKMTFILHETCHYTLFKSKKINTVLGSLAGYITGTNFEIFRAIHMLHHRFNGQDVDPQVDDYLGGDQNLTKKKLMYHLTIRLTGFDFFSFVEHYFPFMPENLRKNHLYLKKFTLPKNSLWFYLGVIITQGLIALLVTNFGEHIFLMFAYPLAAVTVSLSLARLRSCAEHMRPPRLRSVDFTRSHLPNLFDNIFVSDLNFNFHLEHHLFPHMPASNLPKFFLTFRETIHDKDTLGKSMLLTVKDIWTECPR